LNTEKSYQELVDLYKETALIGHIESTLEWDTRTYLPDGGHDYRAEEVSYLAVMRHQKAVNPRIGELLGLLESASQNGSDGSPMAVNVREWRRDYEIATKLPEDLVAELAKVTTLAQNEWKEARARNDFKAFQPWLKKVVDLKKREADCLGWTKERYDALLDSYEPGAKTEEVADVLSQLRDRLIPIVRAVAEAPRKPNRSILTRHYPEAAQAAFGRKVATAIGFDFNRGRIDITTHPFCITLGPADIRITTRYLENYVNGALFGTLHEAGHGLYEQNLPAEHAGTPSAEAVSLGIHESQSRLWENIVGRSRAFWTKWFPEAKAHFSSLADVSMEQFAFAINAVEPSFIRVEADETTYNLHILLRFELEREMLNGNLSISDVPAAWNEKFRKYFGVTVPRDADGCLQDVHWSAGLIGYFPTYSLGNLNAAQFYEKAVEELGNQDANFAAGNYSPLLGWLKTNIHAHGRRYRSADLTKVVTGKPLSSDALISYLTGKAKEWYGVTERLGD
jgi:carboxypeptidase Taq